MSWFHAVPALARLRALFPEARAECAALICCLLLPWFLIYSRGAADAAGVVLGGLFLLHSRLASRWGWTRNAVLRIGVLAWGWMLVVSPFAADSAESFKVALPWIRWLLLYAAMVFWVLTRETSLRLCALNIAVMLVFVLTDTVWQYVTGLSLTGHVPDALYRLTGPLNNVKVGVFVAKLAFPGCAILLYCALRDGSRPALIGSIALLAASVVVVLLSGGRTAFFSCLLALGAMTATLVMTEPAMRLRSLLAMAAALGVTLLALITQPVLQDRLAWLVANISGLGASSYGQLGWVGLQLGREHWITGAGLKGFRVLCLPFLESGQVNHCNLHPHNIYIEWLSELGVPGLLLLLALVGALLREALVGVSAASGRGRILAALALGALVMHFFPVMATQSFFSNWPALLLWYAAGLARASLNMLGCCSEKDYR